jgi:hypothetical protein
MVEYIDTGLLLRRGGGVGFTGTLGDMAQRWCKIFVGRTKIGELYYSYKETMPG